MASSGDLDRRVSRLAERRFGLITLEQALAAGHTPDSVRHRVETGRWTRVASGLYRIAGAPTSWQGDTLGAVLAAPDGAVASHASAAALLGWRAPPPLPHVTVQRGSNARSRVSRVHRTVLEPVDCTSVGIIPVTTPARTLVDCAPALAPRDLRELVDRALTSGILRSESVHRAIERLGRRPGVPALRAALDVWAPGIERDSVAEARLFRLLADWGLPEPVTLHRVLDVAGRTLCELDVAWPRHLVGLEYDSVAHHGPSHWARDDERRAAARALGWTIVTADKSDLQPGGHGRLRSTLERLLLVHQTG